MNKRKKDEVNLYIVDSDVTFQNKIINTLKNNSNCRINLYNSTKDFFYIFNSENNAQGNELKVVLIASDLPDQEETFYAVKQIKKIDKDTEIILLTEKENMEYISEAFVNGVYGIIKKNENALYRIENSINAIKSMKLFMKKKKSIKIIAWLFGSLTVIMVLLYFFLK
jgi:DNA-binding NarL/FixJ family response regulator